MGYDLVIKNGSLVLGQEVIQADLAVNGEQIAAIGSGLSGRHELDASGRLVTPGAVDIHVHMQMPLADGLVSADDFFTGTRAAAFGGTTTIVDFVEPQESQSLVDAIRARRALAAPCVVGDYALHMTIGPNEIAKLDQVSQAFRAGCTSFKMYMAYGLRLDDAQMLQALEAVRNVGGLPVVHAENWDLITLLSSRHVAAGNISPRWHPRSRPAEFEGEAAGRLIDMAAFVGTPVHIFHVSCQQVVERIAGARRRGMAVTGETCPQYLYLTEDAYEAPGVEGALPVCSPPLRTPADQQALWQALGGGDLQIVTTDHCPFGRADKARGRSDFRQIPGGVPSIEMRFAAIYSGGVRTGLLTPGQWVAACCTEPARLAGLSRKGRLAPGFDADIVLFDPERKVRLSTDFLHESVDWTPYQDLELTGWPQTTIRRGQVIVDKGIFLAKPGSGRYIHRSEPVN